MRLIMIALWPCSDRFRRNEFRVQTLVSVSKYSVCYPFEVFHKKVYYFAWACLRYNILHITALRFGKLRILLAERNIQKVKQVKSVRHVH